MPRDEQFDTFVQVGIILQSMPDKRIRRQKFSHGQSCIRKLCTRLGRKKGWGKGKATNELKKQYCVRKRDKTRNVSFVNISAPNRLLMKLRKVY